MAARARTGAVISGAANALLLDSFCDALWLEDGLSKNTLEAYRRDLTLFAAWLARDAARKLAQAREIDVHGFLAARHLGPKSPKASSDARLLSSLKRFYQYGVREKLVAQGFTVLASTPEELNRTTRDQLDRYGKLFKQAGIKAD